MNILMVGIVFIFAVILTLRWIAKKAERREMNKRIAEAKMRAQKRRQEKKLEEYYDLNRPDEIDDIYDGRGPLNPVQKKAVEVLLDGKELTVEPMHR